MRLADLVRGAAAAVTGAGLLCAGLRWLAPPRPVARIEIDGPGPVAVEFAAVSPGAAIDSCEVGAAGVSVRVPPGGGRAYARHESAIVWPRSAPIAGGAVVTFHVEPLRDVSIPGDGEFRFVPDRTRVPVGPPARLEALEAWIDTQSPAVACRADDERIARVPSTAWWGFGSGPHGAIVLRATERDDRFRIVARGVRVLRRRPTVAGREIPDQSLVAPGRLDLAAAAAVRRLVECGSFRGAVLVPRGCREPLSVADSDDYTLWHPSFGIAWTTADAGGLADAPPQPGAVAFVAESGAPMSGTVAVWPSWAGGSETFSRPHDHGLRLSGRGVERIVFAGLPPGPYRFDHAFAAGDRMPAQHLQRGAVDVSVRPVVVRARLAPP